MRFTLVDRILDLQPGAKITTVKTLSLAEEYLADHFPRFPVMPGVLMLEAMTHASAWLIRVSEDFAHSVVVLKEARNIKYGAFVKPGQVLTITAEILKQDDRDTQLKVQGTVGGNVACGGRLVLERFNLSEKRPDMSATDAHLKTHLRELLALLYSPQEASAANAPGGGQNHTHCAPPHIAIKQSTAPSAG